MTNDEFMHYWRYFLSLDSDFKYTSRYVEHQSVNFKHNKQTYSIEFLKFLLLVCAEFETVCKLLCREMDVNFNMDSDIAQFSEPILIKYPKIVATEVITPYEKIKPLSNWKVNNSVIRGQNKKMCYGLDWWSTYNGIKHKRHANFEKATFINSLEALASLFVVELYLHVHINQVKAHIKLPHPEYFGSEYLGSYIISKGKSLPDFT